MCESNDSPIAGSCHSYEIYTLCASTNSSPLLNHVAHMRFIPHRVLATQWKIYLDVLTGHHESNFLQLRWLHELLWQLPPMWCYYIDDLLSNLSLLVNSLQISIPCPEFCSTSDFFGCCRMDNEMQMDYEEFLSSQRTMLQREGFRIKAVISSQMDALRGPCLGDRIFKLPNPIFGYSMEDHAENPKSKLLQPV